MGRLRSEITALVEPELVHWAAGNLTKDTLSQALDQYCKTQPLATKYSVKDGQVWLNIAGEIYDVQAVKDGANAAITERSAKYLQFFQSVVEERSIDVDINLALFTGDVYPANIEVPLLAFQKQPYQDLILIPDIDFLDNNFYENTKLDTLQYYDKMLSAIFAGATTGSSHTLESIEAGTSQRISSMLYFRDSSRVTFKLPMIIQHRDDEVKQALVRLGLGGRFIGWQEQLAHRFVISMDGNGATCSRIVRTLRSNSVLTKYDSNQNLYYFGALVPWQHYLPVRRDKDVENFVDLERNSPGHFEKVSIAGKKFADDFLSKTAIFDYTESLIHNYAKCIERPTQLSVAGAFRYAKSDAVSGSILVHASSHADQTAALGTWIGSLDCSDHIEGLTLNIAGGLALDEVWYQVCDEHGIGFGFKSSSVYCGTRGQSQPIWGLQVGIAGPGRERFSVRYEAIFRGVDGVVSARDSDWCRVEPPAPLCAVRVYFVARDPTPA